MRATWAVDPKRFISSITAMVRALFYHHTYYQEKLLDEMEVRWSVLKDRESAIASVNLSDAEYAAFTKISTDQPYLPLGATPRVFQYGFDQHSHSTLDGCGLRFYEGETIYVHWKKLPPRLWETDLPILGAYFQKFPQMQLPSSENLQAKEKAELLAQCAERAIQLAEIVRAARHKRDLAAYGLAKMLRRENHKNKLRLLSDSAV